MKNTTLLILLFFTFNQVLAQKSDLFVRTNENGLYLEHKVVAKESFFSIGRLYNLSPNTIAAFNKVDINKGISIDQKLKIPLMDTNFTQQGNKGTPVYYKVGDGDNLTKISKVNRSIPINQIRNWNNLKGDAINKGQKLVIGFMISNEMTSVTIDDQKVDKDLAKKEEKDEKAALEKERAELKAVEEEERKRLEKQKTEVKTIIPAVEKKEVVAPVTINEGFFKSSFELQVKKYPVSKSQTVTAGIFKTASGWQDTKYYLLVDGVPPGTIIKIINPTNSRVIYAKVLGEMSGIRQNEGMDIRICNSAVAALEIAETDKFIVKISY